MKTSEKLNKLAKLAKSGGKRYNKNVTIDGNKFTATNGEILLTMNIPAKFDGEQRKFDVSYNDIARIAKVIDDSEITISLSDNKAIIAGVHCFIGSPTLVNVESSKEVIEKLTLTDEIKKCINEVAQFTGKDEFRPGLNYIYITRDHIVATDALVLSWRKIETGINTPILLNPEFMKYMPDDCDFIKVVNGRLFSDSRDGSISVLTCDYKYPDFEAVIPVNYTGEITIDGDSVIKSLKRAKARKMDYIAIVLKNGAIGFSYSENYENDKDKFSVSIPGNVEGGDITVILKTKYLQKVIKPGINTIDYNDKHPKRPIKINNNTIIMPFMNPNGIGDGFTPEVITLQEEQKENEQVNNKQQIIDLPDETFVVIGGKKPKGGKTVKAWIVNNLDGII